jgi:hypothetical protein
MYIYSSRLCIYTSTVHRRDQKGRDWAFHKSLMQPKRIRRKMASREKNADGNLREAKNIEGRRTHF